jgi:hypothetical protein
VPATTATRAGSTGRSLPATDGGSAASTEQKPSAKSAPDTFSEDVLTAKYGRNPSHVVARSWIRRTCASAAQASVVRTTAERASQDRSPEANLRRSASAKVSRTPTARAAFAITK